MESGVYNQQKPHIPAHFNKQLYNNIKNDDQYHHKTPLGAGMVTWANNRVTLQPATKELNFEKLQTSIAILKTDQGNLNILIMSMHVPNRLSTVEKEK